MGTVLGFEFLFGFPLTLRDLHHFHLGKDQMMKQMMYPPLPLFSCDNKRSVTGEGISILLLLFDVIRLE